MRDSFQPAILILSILLFFTFGCTNRQIGNESPTVNIVYENGRAKLLRNGEPYFIKGGSGHENMEKLAAYGGNSIRTWNTHGASGILDQAHEFGLTVTLGLEIGKQYWGEDFNYWNFKAVNEKIEELRIIIRKYKDHPALLMWGIGNEVDLFGGNRHIIYYTINRIAKMIHEEDPNHPVMTAINVGFEWDRYAFSYLLLSRVDILGFNAFDRVPNIFTKIYSKTGWKKAYILSEYGPSGHWESVNTEWGAAKELNSTAKAKLVKQHYQTIHQDSTLFLGGYAFYWGFKYEITNTWFSLFSEEGYETESVNILKTKWTGHEPSNRAPVIEDIILNAPAFRDNFYLKANEQYTASLFATDPDNDALTFRWELRHEESNFYDSGKSRVLLNHYLENTAGSTTKFQAPTEIGAYRLLGFVYDGQNHVATHNVPFYVLPN
jgi:hypothetical protein